MNIYDFIKSEKKDRYVFIGNNVFADKFIDRTLVNYEVSNILPKGGLLKGNKLVRDDDILSRDWKELDRDYKYIIQTEKADGRRKLFKTIPEDNLVDFTLEANKGFIEQQIRKKLNISKSKAQKLIKSKNNMNVIYNEVQKLKHLNRQEVNEYINNLVIVDDNEIFEFINNVFEGKDYIENLNKLNDHPIKLLYMITKQTRGLIICRDLIGEKNKKIADNYNLHPYQVQIFKTISSIYSLEQLMDIFKLCCEYERKIKTGRIDPYLALDYICLYIYKQGGV